MTRRARAFSLIEVILALAIGTLVVLMVFAVLDSALRAHTRLDTQGRAGRVAGAIFNQLARDLAAAYLYKDVEEGFVGTDRGELDRFDFLALSPSSIELGQIASQPTEVGYLLQPVSGGAYHRLYRRESFYTDTKPTGGGTLVPLYEGVFQFDVSYHDGEAFAASFTGKKTLPRQVRVKLGIWVGEGTPETRQKAQEYSFVRTFPVYAEGLKLDIAPPKEEKKEGEEGGEKKEGGE